MSSQSYRVRGFTLIELLITVAIVAILARIAVPAYTDYVIRGRLVEGRATLSDWRVKMEQFFQDNRVYTNACAAGSIAATPANTTYWSYTCQVLNATTYTLSATGQGTVNGMVYTIDQNNSRATTQVISGWSGSGSSCWVIKNTGEC